MTFNVVIMTFPKLDSSCLALSTVGSVERQKIPSCIVLAIFDGYFLKLSYFVYYHCNYPKTKVIGPSRVLRRSTSFFIVAGEIWNSTLNRYFLPYFFIMSYRRVCRITSCDLVSYQEGHNFTPDN